MTLLLRELERVDSRVLGALRCIDAGTRAQVPGPLQVQIAGARVLRNRSGLYVIAQADALAAHAAAFDAPPVVPALGSVALQATVSDPAGRYLPRRAALALPRDPAPANAALAGSLLRAIELPLYSSATAPTGLNWSVLRLSVRDSASGDALGGTLVIARAGSQVLARGLSDWRGEALLAVAGVPVTTWSDDPHAVVVTELAARLEWVFDPASGTRTPQSEVRAGHTPARQPLVDPDQLEANRATLPHATRTVALAAGRSQTLSLPLALP